MGRKQKYHQPLPGNLDSVLGAIAREKKPKKIKEPKAARKYERKK